MLLEQMASSAGDIQLGGNSATARGRLPAAITIIENASEEAAPSQAKVTSASATRENLSACTIAKGQMLTDTLKAYAAIWQQEWMQSSWNEMNWFRDLSHAESRRRSRQEFHLMVAAADDLLADIGGGT
jgi:hypothetical protein